LAGAVIQVVTDRRVAVMGELASRFEIPLIPARRMVDQHNARERAGAQRPGGIGRDGLIVVAVDCDGFRDHAFVGHCRPPLLVRTVFEAAGCWNLRMLEPRGVRETSPPGRRSVRPLSALCYRATLSVKNAPSRRLAGDMAFPDTHRNVCVRISDTMPLR